MFVRLFMSTALVNVSRETSNLFQPGMFHVSQAPFPHVSRESLTDTKLREDHIQQILDIDRAGDASQRIRR